MTWFDAVVLSVIGLSTLFAAIRGGLREAATLIALGGGALLAFICLNPVLSITGAKDSFFATVSVAVVLITVFFIGLYVVFHFVLRGMQLNGRAQFIDKAAGGAFGVIRGIALIGLAYLGYGYYLDEANQPDSVRNAVTQPMAAAAADFFESLAPDSAYIETHESQLKETDASKADAAQTGYARGDRAGLSEMITTVTTSDTPETQLAARTENDPIADVLVEEDQP